MKDFNDYNWKVQRRAKEIAKELDLHLLKVNTTSSHPWYLTEKAKLAFLELSMKVRDRERKARAKVEKEALLILKELKGDGEEGGIECSREEITGLGGANKNRNFCNTGFGGGSMMRLAAA